MSPEAITFITYLWHYVVARLVYDQVLRPLIHGHLSTALVVGVAAAGVLVTGKWRTSRRRR